MHTIQHGTDHRIATRVAEHPGPVLPGRIVPYVLRVATFQVGDPMPLAVTMKADDVARNTAGTGHVLDRP
jgi:hypothetical protein